MTSNILEILVGVLSSVLAIFVGLLSWLVAKYKKLKDRNDQLRELGNVMGSEYGMILSKDRDGNDNVIMKPDFREKLTETYKRYRKLDLDKDL